MTERSIERRPYDDRQDELIVDGERLGFELRARWDLGDGELRLGNTTTGHTVAGATTADLIEALIAKRDEVARARAKKAAGEAQS